MESGRHERKEQHPDVLVGECGHVGEVTQDLVGPEAVRMVIGVSLDLEGQSGGRRVPRAEAVDTFVDSLTVLISANLLPRKSIMLEIVHRLEPEHSRESVPKLEQKACLAKQCVNRQNESDMHHEESYHHVVHGVLEVAGFAALGRKGVLFNALDFTVPGVGVRSYHS